jgi:hypothetical protein
MLEAYSMYGSAGGIRGGGRHACGTVQHGCCTHAVRDAARYLPDVGICMARIDGGFGRQSKMSDKPVNWIDPDDEKKAIEDYGSVVEWKKSQRESVRDDLEQDLKATAYLMAGNAAGLVGSMTFLKDYNPQTSPIHGVGIVIALFAAGFIVSALALLSFFVVRYNTKLAYEYRRPFPRDSMMLFRVLQGLSLLVLIIAILVIAAKVIWI